VESERLMPPYVKQYFVRENAHNNVLQIAAETGITGLLCCLLIASRLLGRRQSTPSDNPSTGAAVAGLAAFGLSSLAGHPLLTSDVLLAVALVTGVVVAARPGAETRLAPPLIRRIAIVVSVALVLVLPLRVLQARRSANLEHLGRGVSSWTHAEDGQEFRWGGTRVTLFIPSDAARLRVPLRLAPQYQSAEVSISLDRRPADRIVLTSERWQSVTLLVPPGRDERFLPLDLTVHVAEPPASSEGVKHVVMIGKVVTH
jgi:O-antigen ligase